MKNNAKCDTMGYENIRNRLKTEIMSLTDLQVEYVIRRMRDVQNEKGFDLRSRNREAET